MSEQFQISLAAARAEAGLTKRAAAQKLDVTVDTLRRWERRPELVKTVFRRAMQDLYGVPLEHIRFTSS